VPIGDEAPEIVNTYIEMTPDDTVKYELDKVTGILKMDRPQLYSSACPVLYGLVPQTYCGERVADLCMTRNATTGIVGDGDPLDICVLSEKHINHGNVLMRARPIGGLRMVDDNEADDKIIAVMQGDAAYERYEEIADCPASLLTRLRHYFLTYKQSPDAAKKECEITHVYDKKEAHDVIRRSQEDYKTKFDGLEKMLGQALRR